MAHSSAVCLATEHNSQRSELPCAYRGLAVSGLCNEWPARLVTEPETDRQSKTVSVGVADPWQVEQEADFRPFGGRHAGGDSAFAASNYYSEVPE